MKMEFPIILMLNKKPVGKETISEYTEARSAYVGLGDSLDFLDI